MVVLLAWDTPRLLLYSAATLTLPTSLHLHLPAHRLVLPRPPPGHRDHHLHQDITAAGETGDLERTDLYLDGLHLDRPAVEVRREAVAATPGHHHVVRHDLQSAK